MTQTQLRLLLCVAIAALAWQFAPGVHAARAGLALFVLIAGLWMTQALPLAVTALAVPLLAIVLGLLPAREALAPFAHPVIFLFMGGFAIAAALSRQGLDRALANAVLRLAGRRQWAAVLLLAALTALLSMWMSNTATVALMLPLGLGLLRAGRNEAGAREQAFVLLALAYSASIGGMATLVGSPPNAIAAAQAGIGFAHWLRLAGPVALAMWPMMLAILAVVLRPQFGGRVDGMHEPMVWTAPRVATGLIFAFAVTGWVAGAPLARWLGIASDFDTVVALAAVVALVVSGCLDWRGLEGQVQWGVLLLFGGGLALSEVMSATGASRLLAHGLLDAVHGAPTVWVVLGVVAFVVFLTELVSNTASAALLMPLLLPVALALGMPQAAMAVAIALSASCAFMLPVATPPNALVFATDRVPQATMMRCGFWLNVAAIALITAFAAGVWP